MTDERFGGQIDEEYAADLANVVLIAASDPYATIDDVLATIEVPMNAGLFRLTLGHFARLVGYLGPAVLEIPNRSAVEPASVEGFDLARALADAERPGGAGYESVLDHLPPDGPSDLLSQAAFCLAVVGARCWRLCGTGRVLAAQVERHRIDSARLAGAAWADHARLDRASEQAGRIAAMIAAGNRAEAESLLHRVAGEAGGGVLLALVWAQVIAREHLWLVDGEGASVGPQDVSRDATLGQIGAAALIPGVIHDAELPAPEREIAGDGRDVLRVLSPDSHAELCWPLAVAVAAARPGRPAMAPGDAQPGGATLSLREPGERSPAEQGVPDLAAWRRARRLALALIEASDERYREELVVIPFAGPSAWNGGDPEVVEMLATGLWHAGNELDLIAEAVPLCTVAAHLFDPSPQALTGEPTPWQIQLANPEPGSRAMPVYRRLQRAVSCPGRHTPDHAGCARVADRLAKAHRSAPLVWETAITPDSPAAETGQAPGPSGCARCHAESPAFYGRPAGMREWTWRLCACGAIEQVQLPEVAGDERLPWRSMTSQELIQAARDHGFEQIDPLDSTTEYFVKIRPTITLGGDPRWLEAIRAATGALAHAEPPRAHPLDGRERGANETNPVPQLLLALLLAGLTYYVHGEETGLPPEQIDLAEVLTVGPDALHARLARHLPDSQTMTSWCIDAGEWLIMHRRWKGKYVGRDGTTRSDPVPLAWAALAAQPRDLAELAGHITPTAPAYLTAYTTLTGLTGPS